jgi:DNA modification methylase
MREGGRRLLEINKIYQGNALKVLKTFPDESIHCCVTSPPYWGLRDYGVEGQIGLESSPEEYVTKMVEVFREVKRVLRKDGTLWLNLGDSYASGGMSNPSSKSTLGGGKDLGAAGYSITRKIPNGLKPKDLVGIPWMVAFALRADGWYLRQDIIWHKPNCMPESVKDRCTKAHEYIFLLSKSRKYYYDHEVIKEPVKEISIRRAEYGWNCDRPSTKNASMNGEGIHTKKMGTRFVNPDGRNKRSVWTVTTKPFKEAHFATFPEKLIEPCILAGCPEGGIVLDPFMGSGTTAVVALKHNRNYIGIELNPEYIKIAEKRISETTSNQIELPEIERNVPQRQFDWLDELLGVGK